MKALLSLIVLLCLGVFGATAFAQEDPITLPGGDAACTAPDVAMEQINALVGSTITATRTHDLSRYTVVYLINEGAVSSESLVSQDSITSASKEIQVVTSWDAFVQLNDETPVDAIFVHASIASSVDQVWFQEAYRNGLPIITVDMTFGEWAELVGDQCSFAEHPADGPLSNRPAKVNGENFYIYGYWLLHAGDLAVVSDGELNLCSKRPAYAYDITSATGVGIIENDQDLSDLVELGLLANKVEIDRAIEAVMPQADQIMASSCRPPLDAEN
jgi:hypothetical protein